MHEVAAALKQVDSQLLTVALESLELSTKLNTVDAASDKKLEELAGP